MAENGLKRIDKTTDIAAVDPDSPVGLMMKLMSGDGPFDVEGFGKMLEYQERREANQARKAFASDFAMVQSSIAAVVKTKNNPQTRSKYAGLDAVIETAKPVYTARGFSIICYEGKAEKAEDVRVYADVLHRAGHKETYYLDVPLGGVGIQGKVNMIAIHAKATSVTYGRRYLLCMIWNIPTQDDDGNPPNQKPLPEIPTPTFEEQGIIDQIAMKIPAPPGMRVDATKLYPIFWAKYQKYPANPNYIEKGAAWISGMGLKKIFIPDNRSEFEKQQGLPGDEDSVPDTPEDVTAAEKFGEENEIVPCRFICNACSHEYDKYTKIDQCPKCLNKDVIDRKA